MTTARLCREAIPPGRGVPLQAPGISIDLDWLRRQRQDLGADRFREIVAESVGEERLEAFWEMLER